MKMMNIGDLMADEGEAVPKFKASKKAAQDDSERREK